MLVFPGQIYSCAAEHPWILQQVKQRNAFLCTCHYTTELSNKMISTYISQWPDDTYSIHIKIVLNNTTFGNQAREMPNIEETAIVLISNDRIWWTGVAVLPGHTTDKLKIDVPNWFLSRQITTAENRSLKHSILKPLVRFLFYVNIHLNHNSEIIILHIWNSIFLLPKKCFIQFHSLYFH